MMRKIYRCFFLFTVISFLYSISFIGTEVIKSAIPGIHSGIIIESLDGDKNNQEVFQTIAQYAQDKQVTLHKLIFRIGKDGQTQKEIYTFDKRENSTYSYKPIPSDNPTNFYDYTELSNEEPLGLYLMAEAPPEKMAEELYAKGIEIKIEKTQWLFYFASSLFMSIGQLFFILFLCLIVAFAFYQSSIRKKIGIMKVLGCSHYKLILRDIFIDITLFTGLLIIFIFVYPHMFSFYRLIFILGILLIGLLQLFGSWLVQSLGTIANKMKGEKPYRWLVVFNLLIKIAIMCFMVINAKMLLAKMNENHTFKQQLTYWTKLPDYYHLMFSNTTRLLPRYGQSQEEWKIETDQVNQILLPLLEKSEQSGGIFLSVPELNSNHNLYPYIEKNAFWMANHNAIHELKVKDAQGTVIPTLDENSFYLLIPENKKEYTELFMQEAENELTFYQNPMEDETKKYRGELKVLYTQSNQLIFNYNHQLWENMYSFNPVIVLITLPLIQPNIDIWISDVSNGTYLFREPEEVHQFITDNQLENDFSGLVSIKSQINQRIVSTRLEYYTAMAVVVLLIVSFIAVEIYSSLIYAEMNKKRLFLQYILGKTLWQRHRNYYIKMIVISLGVLGGLSIWQEGSGFIIMSVFCFEIFLLFFNTSVAENKQRLEVIKND
ncbi:DUF1430 domain-containing protein [Enterococcus villorum]|nr:hypothetical protein [Enterococcus villorum]